MKNSILSIYETNFVSSFETNEKNKQWKKAKNDTYNLYVFK